VEQFIEQVPVAGRIVNTLLNRLDVGANRITGIPSFVELPGIVEEVAADPSGAAGVKGEVDNHWCDVFGAATLGTLINIGVATIEEPQLTYGGIVTMSRDPVDAAIADGVQRSASGVTNRVVDRGLAIPPTIRVGAGTKITVVATRRVVRVGL
jgi:type IV secretory pathway VirB10-like protein